MAVAAFTPDFSQMIKAADYPSHGAQRFPHRMAIVGDKGSFTYQELDQASDRFAQFLLERGYAPGSRIAYVGVNSELMFAVLFGSIRAGMVFVPLNWRYAAPELRYVVEDADAQLLIYGDEVKALVTEAARNFEKPVSLMALYEKVGTFPSLQEVLEQWPAERPQTPVEDDQCVLQLYTSGTTGKPKGVMLSHRALSISRWVEIGAPDWDDWSDVDVIHSAMPSFHAGGLGWMMIGLVRSLTCVLTADPSVANLLALSRRHSVTRTFLVPAVIRMVLDVVEDADEPPPPIRSIYYGAAPMDPELIRRCMRVFTDCSFGQFYGMTEAAGAIAHLGPSDHDPQNPQRLKSVGKAMACYELEVRDAQGQPVAAGVHGELWVRSPANMIGYWRLPEATEEVMRDGWYRTGDGVYMDPDDYIFLTDRIKDMIVTGGENVYPIEVEQVLRQHPAVHEVVVIGVADPKWGETICAVIEWRPGQVATLEELREFARPQIAGYKLPRQLRVTAQLPRTATGKLQRAVVRAGS